MHFCRLGGGCSMGPFFETKSLPTIIFSYHLLSLSAKKNREKIKVQTRHTYIKKCNLCVCEKWIVHVKIITASNSRQLGDDKMLCKTLRTKKKSAVSQVGRRNSGEKLGQHHLPVERILVWREEKRIQLVMQSNYTSDGHLIIRLQYYTWKLLKL